MKKLLTILIATMALTLASGSVFASDRADKGWQLIEQGAMIVDVRTPGEFASGHLDNAINFPLSEIEQHFADIDKTQSIVVYCRSGNRSGKAYDYLVSQGFTNVHNGGGLQEMQAAIK
ncbi:rhodanese-like domain-containing protein [Vibrio sp.]|uniref:rhodanese-like domain-containing protein n=1 Tax=Vibrio sp. TaxID=678 RepID=UPI003D0C2174